MNYYDNNPYGNNQMPFMPNPMMNNDINYKLNELDSRIKKLEQRISRLESNKQNNSYIEPDDSLYMI